MNKKYRLQDLVSPGSNARRNVNSDVIITDNLEGGYGYGDILDANSVHQLIKEKAAEITTDAIGDALDGKIESLENKNNEQDQIITQL